MMMEQTNLKKDDAAHFLKQQNIQVKMDGFFFVEVALLDPPAERNNTQQFKWLF